MKWFGSRAKRSGPTRQESLAVKPVQLVKAEVEQTGGGGVRLKVKVQPARWARWLVSAPRDMSKSFELDALGVLVWTSCDGRTSVQQIIRRLAKQYKLTEREAEVGTIQFLHLLVKKGLVGMAMQDRKT